MLDKLAIRCLAAAVVFLICQYADDFFRDGAGILGGLLMLVALALAGVSAVMHASASKRRRGFPIEPVDEPNRDL